ncbi:MAG: S8 family serine peptidase [Bacteroidales bacterium]|nr:S8 family serine peptidase [Bacteroidales bacterium]
MKFVHLFCLLFFLSFPSVTSTSLAIPASLTTSLATSATISYKFRAYLSDKGSVEYPLDEPYRFLSRQAVARRGRQGVTIDESDLPISRDYFRLVEQAGGKIVAHSKWLNTLVVEMSDSMAINRVESLPFVDSVKYVWRGVDRYSREEFRPRLEIGDAGFFDDHDTEPSLFGVTSAQFSLHNAAPMIRAGYQGKGIGVGVIDAGFTNFDVIPWFDTMELRGYADFVPGGSIFSSSDHGTKVLSTMAINRPGKMMGSATEASYWLLRSEDVASEFPVEEDYWVQAIEYADSVGVDVVNTSLGYNQFNDSSLNYSHDDLTGKVSIMSRAADKAFQKGMIVVVSAGNEGNKQWQKSTPPGDAQNVLAVGAVGVDSVIASFSSRGQMADGRVKPDLVSVGRGTVTIGQDGRIGYTNGTSLSSPFLAGLIASLWSVNPELHRDDLVNIVKHSSDRFNAPDSIYGYGIPDFTKAMNKVLRTLPVNSKRVISDRWLIEPVTSSGYTVTVKDPPFTGDAYRVRILDEAGGLVEELSISDNHSVFVPLTEEVRKNNNDLYFVVEEPFKQHTYRIRL